MEYELYHYGIKGMKWGVRRFQRKDGSLTSAGKRRRKQNYLEEAGGMSNEELRAKVNRLNLEKRYATLTKNRTTRSTEGFNNASKLGNAAGSGKEIAKNAASIKGKNTAPYDLAGSGINAVTSSISTAKTLRTIRDDKRAAKQANARLKNMSDKDLKDAVDRMDLEQRYSSLKSESVSRGKVRVGQVLDVAAGVLAVSASATVMAVQIRKLING